MTDRLSPDEIARLEDLEKKAAPAPWDKDWCYGACRHIDRNVDTDAFYGGEGSGWGRYDGRFIAESRNALPRLLAELRALREERDEFKAMLHSCLSQLTEARSRQRGLNLYGPRPHLPGGAQ